MGYAKPNSVRGNLICPAQVVEFYKMCQTHYSCKNLRNGRKVTNRLPNKSENGDQNQKVNLKWFKVSM